MPEPSAAQRDVAQGIRAHWTPIVLADAYAGLDGIEEHIAQVLADAVAQERRKCISKAEFLCYNVSRPYERFCGKCEACLVAAALRAGADA